MAIRQKFGVANLSFKGDGSGTVFKFDLSLAPINLDTRGNYPSSVDASVSSSDASLSVSSATISGDRITLTFSKTFTVDCSVNLVLYFDSK